MRNTTERRQAILETLCERRREQIANLAFEFDVTRRTIETDIQILSLTYPIYTTKGTGGGIHVVEGYYIGRKFLNPKQEELLRRLNENLVGEDRLNLQKIISSFALSKPNKKE